MRTETIQMVKIEPSDGMHLRNKLTGEVYESCIYLAKSLSAENFEEITTDEYKKAVADREKQEIEKERK